MKQLIYSLITIATLASASTQAATKSVRHNDFARVTHVDPVYHHVQHSVPQQNCWVETVREERPRHRHDSAAPAIIGGIIGGVIGNELGKGSHNKQIGSVVGSVLGITVAKDIQHQHNKHAGAYDVNYRDVERCETNYTIEHTRELQGYNVSYRYNGRDYKTFMREHPGKRIRVAVNVRPASH